MAVTKQLGAHSPQGGWQQDRLTTSRVQNMHHLPMVLVSGYVAHAGHFDECACLEAEKGTMLIYGAATALDDGNCRNGLVQVLESAEVSVPESQNKQRRMGNLTAPRF